MASAVPLFLSGITSDPTNVGIACISPPTTPATVLFESKTASDVATHIGSPPPKVALLKTSPARQPQILVSRPQSDHDAAVTIKYAIASHDRFEKDKKEVGMPLRKLELKAESK